MQDEIQTTQDEKKKLKMIQPGKKNQTKTKPNIPAVQVFYIEKVLKKSGISDSIIK